MRKFLIFLIALSAFSAQASQNPTQKTVQAEQALDAETAEKHTKPIYKRYEIKYEPKNTAINKTKQKSIPSKNSVVSKPKQPEKSAISTQPVLNNVVSPKKDEVQTRHHHEQRQIKDNVSNVRHLHNSQHKRHKEKHSKSAVRVNINVNSPRPTYVVNRVVTTPEVTVMRPVIYDNNIYSANAYTCGERSGVKYCTDYRGRALSGRVVNKYDDSVAYENYRHGYQQGETTVFSQDGMLLRKTNYKKSLKDGKEYAYFGNGKIEYSAEYKKGALHGNVEQYNPNGKRIGRMTYRHGYLQKRHCTYDTTSPMLLAQIEQKNYNELILCEDGYNY